MRMAVPSMTASAFLFVALVAPMAVRGSIQCYYCGHRELCPLPFKAGEAGLEDQISCDETCLHFDGKATEDGKRVIVRTCADGDQHVQGVQANNCKEDFEYHGAVGRMCTCNGFLCNGVADPVRVTVVLPILMSGAVALLSLWLSM